MHFLFESPLYFFFFLPLTWHSREGLLSQAAWAPQAVHTGTLPGMGFCQAPAPWHPVPPGQHCPLSRGRCCQSLLK